MLMNKMYTLSMAVEVVTDHEPLLPLYNGPGRPRQLRVDWHRTKLLAYNFNLIHEPGVTSPCDYGSRHPPSRTLLKKAEKSPRSKKWGRKLDFLAFFRKFLKIS